MQRYKRCKKLIFDGESKDGKDDQQSNVGGNAGSSTSLWGDTINKIKPLIAKHSTVMYFSKYTGK